MNGESKLPEYLSSFESLQQHFRAQLEGLSPAEKGDRFTHFVQRLVPQTDIGKDYEIPVLSKNKSVDRGVDISAKGKTEDAVLYIQSKMWADRTETIDSALSKFQAYISARPDSAQGILIDLSNTRAHFLLVTLSPLTGILRQYEKNELASKSFYRQYKSENRIHFIDGHDIFQTLRTAYSKITPLRSELILNLATPCISIGNVHVGVISSHELKSLYREFGDALFFENVRDFLGVPRAGERFGRTTPNNEIFKTLTTEPEKMLSRNNGLVFGADRVEVGEDGHILTLANGSVVNGCQTTMCIVESPNSDSHVLVKVVETNDAWDITKSANYQNSVPDIDLELARYLRPQLVKRAASVLGVGIEDRHKSAFQIIDEIYEKKVAYNETRLLYIGLFSRSPNNVFASNYTELVHDLISSLYSGSSYEEDIFDTLFLLQYASQLTLKETQAIFDNPIYAPYFERLYHDDSLTYRCYISILALCGSLKVNIAERSADPNAELARTKSFFSAAKVLLTSEPAKFSRFYKLAVKLWMQEMLGPEEDSELRRDMYLKTKASNFTNMFRKLCMEEDLDAKRP